MTLPGNERRSIDRRVGLPDSRPDGVRIERRRAEVDRRRNPDRRPHPPNRALTDREEQRRLVLHIAADPVRQEWLRRFLGRHLEACAVTLDRNLEPAAAEIVRGIASRFRAGDSDLW